jgi:hypothetical protein
MLQIQVRECYSHHSTSSGSPKSVDVIIFGAGRDSDEPGNLQADAMHGAI